MCVRVTPMYAMTHNSLRHDSFLCMLWLLSGYVTTHFLCVACLISMYVMTHFLCMSWLISMYVTTHSFLCMSWLISRYVTTHVCDMIHLYVCHFYVCHDLFLGMSRLIFCVTPMYAMTHNSLQHDSFLYMSWLISRYVTTHFLCVAWLIHAKCRIMDWIYSGTGWAKNVSLSETLIFRGTVCVCMYVYTCVCVCMYVYTYICV